MHSLRRFDLLLGRNGGFVRFASSGSSGKRSNDGQSGSRKDSDRSSQQSSSRGAGDSSSPSPPPAAHTQSWLGKLLQGQSRTMETAHESHSRKLARKDVIYKMQIHNIKPDARDEYLKLYGDYVESIRSGKRKNVTGSLIGSWMVQTGGDQDQCINIWQHDKGYESLDATRDAFREDKSLQDYKSKLLKTLRSRQNQIMLSFSYWGDPEPNDARRIYELRTYTLKPGTLIEWGNHWARAVHLRKSREDGVGGFFTQIGPLYVVHHIWAYKDLQQRKDARDAAWSSPGWDDCVSNTVPLIREMNSRMLSGNPFSPLR